MRKNCSSDRENLWKFSAFSLEVFEITKARFAQVDFFSNSDYLPEKVLLIIKVGIRIVYGPPVDKTKSFHNKSGLSFFDFQLFY